MFPPLSLKRRRALQAAAWYARLNATVVPKEDLAAFRRWRLKPGANAAFSQVETAWRRVAPLQTDPDIMAMLAKPFVPGESQARGRVRLGAAAAWASAAVACGLIVAIWGAWALGGQRYVTAIGGRRTVNLGDGSRLLLDADTRIEVRLSARDRRVRLDRGRLLAEVTHDPARPFVVDAGDLHVTALGTRFVVRRDADHAQVVLLRGSVDVRRGAGPTRDVRLQPNQALEGRTAAPIRVDPVAAIAWTQGRIILQDAAPADAVAEINRYTVHPLRLSPQLAGTPPVSGVFAAGDPDAFVAALTRLRGWRAIRQDDGAVLLSPGPSAPAP